MIGLFLLGQIPIYSKTSLIRTSNLRAPPSTEWALCPCMSKYNLARLGSDNEDGIKAKV